MSTNTTNLALGKAQDSDNAETYLVTTLGSALDTLDAHDHSADGKGLAVKRIASGLDASKPAAGAAAGTVYYATDTDLLYLGDGSTQKTAVIDPTTARGDVIVRGASALARLALGTNGQVLTSNGTDAVWGGGGFVAFANAGDDGKKMQQGTAVTGGEAGVGAFFEASVSVTFSTAFGGAPVAVSCSATGAGSKAYWVQASSASTTGVTLTAVSTVTSEVAGVSVSWLAIG